jgi:hypothetical protein
VLKYIAVTRPHHPRRLDSVRSTRAEDRRPRHDDHRCAYLQMDEPFRVYMTAYQVFASADDCVAAVLKAAYEILQEQAAISDEKLRRTFLKKMSVHRQIMAEYGK